MDAGKESTKSKERLCSLPNPFKWSNYKIKTHEKMRKHIMSDPYGCDRCGDIYNRNDLIKLQAERVCKNCLCSG